MINRRHFIQSSLLLLVGGSHALAATEAMRTKCLSLKPLGRLSWPNATDELRASRFSIGLETLDRRLYDFSRILPALRILPVKHARIQSGWARCETRRGEYDFTWLDDCVDSLVKLGIEPWINLGYGNPLYIPLATNDGAVGWNPIYRPDAMEAWNKFISALVSRYRDRIRYYEIWNEPHLPQFWRNRPPNPVDYANFADQTIRTIKSRFADAKIVAGTVNLNAYSNQFLKTALDQGLWRQVDVITYHQYSRILDDRYEEGVANLRSLLEKYPRNIDVWQGESGCPSAAGTAGALANYRWNDSIQCKWIARRMVLDTHMNISLSSYFHLCDLAKRNGNGTVMGKINYKGLLNASDYSPKPSFSMMCALITLLAQSEPVDFPNLKVWSLPHGKTMVCGFSRIVAGKQYRYLCCWRGGDFDNGSPPNRQCTLHHHDNLQSLFGDMRIYDPVRDTLYEVESDCHNTKELTLPLLDYPLFVLDHNLLNAIGATIS